jgi:cytochrome c1
MVMSLEEDLKQEQDELEAMEDVSSTIGDKMESFITELTKTGLIILAFLIGVFVLVYLPAKFVWSLWMN